MFAFFSSWSTSSLTSAHASSGGPYKSTCSETSQTSSTTTTFFTGIRFYRGKIYETTRYFHPQHLRNAFNGCHGQSIVVSCNNFRLNSTNVKLKIANTWSGLITMNWWERAGRGYRYITTALFVPNSRPGSGTRFHILSHPKWQQCSPTSGTLSSNFQVAQP